MHQCLDPGTHSHTLVLFLIRALSVTEIYWITTASINLCFWSRQRLVKDGQFFLISQLLLSYQKYLQSLANQSSNKYLRSTH